MTDAYVDSECLEAMHGVEVADFFVHFDQIRIAVQHLLLNIRFVIKGIEFKTIFENLVKLVENFLGVDAVGLD